MMFDLDPTKRLQNAREDSLQKAFDGQERARKLLNREYPESPASKRIRIERAMVEITRQLAGKQGEQHD